MNAYPTGTTWSEGNGRFLFGTFLIQLMSKVTLCIYTWFPVFRCLVDPVEQYKVYSGTEWRIKWFEESIWQNGCYHQYLILQQFSFFHVGLDKPIQSNGLFPNSCLVLILISVTFVTFWLTSCSQIASYSCSACQVSDVSSFGSWKWHIGTKIPDEGNKLSYEWWLFSHETNHPHWIKESRAKYKQQRRGD